MPKKAGAIRAGRAFVELFVDNNPLSRGLKIAERRMQAFAAKIRALGASMSTAGFLGTSAVAVAMKVGIEFDDAMRAVQARTQATAAEFENLTAKARELGRSTSYTAAEVAKAMESLGTLGFSPEEIDKAAESVLALGRATDTDLALAAEIAGSMLRAFKMDISQFGMVCDVLVATVNGSAGTLEDFGESFKYASKVAKDAGMNVQDTSIAIGTLANLGIKGTMAGTALRQILLQIATGREKIKKELGVDVVDEKTGQLRLPGAIMLDIGKAIARKPNWKRMEIMKDLFDQRAVTAAMTLTEEQFDRLTEAVNNYQGVSQRTAQVMDAGPGGAWRELTGAVEDLAIGIKDALAPTFRTLALYIRDCINAVTAFIAENNPLMLTVAGVTAGLLILGPIVTSLGVSFMVVATAAGALSTAASVLLAPVGLVVTGMALLAKEGSIVGDVLTGTADTLKSHFAALGSTVSEVFGAMTDAISSGDMKLAIQALLAGVKVELLRLQDMWWSFWESFPGAGYLMEIDDRAFIKRINDIAEAENAMTRIAQQAAALAKAKRRAEFEKMLFADPGDLGLEPAIPAQQQAALGGAFPDWLSSAAATIMKMDPAKILQGVGRFIGEASGAVPEFIANLAMDVAQEAGVVTEIQRSARGTFSSMAAGRMGAATSGSRTERQFDKLLRKQDHANRRLDQFVDLASKARLVFTGALPG